MLDLKQQDNGDLSPDFELVEPTAQHQRDLLILAPGQSKEFPLAGVDSIKYLHDDDTTTYLRTIRQQFTKDGMKVNSIGLDPATMHLTIDAEYENN